MFLDLCCSHSVQVSSICKLRSPALCSPLSDQRRPSPSASILQSHPWPFTTPLWSWPISQHEPMCDCKSVSQHRKTLQPVLLYYLLTQHHGDTRPLGLQHPTQWASACYWYKNNTSLACVLVERGGTDRVMLWDWPSAVSSARLVTHMPLGLLFIQLHVTLHLHHLDKTKTDVTVGAAQGHVHSPFLQ